MKLLSQASRIVKDVIYDRLRYDMTNIVASVSIMFLFSFSFFEIFLRTIFSFVLNILVYLNNDYNDIIQDSRTTDNIEKVTFLARNRNLTFWLQFVIFLALFLLAASLNIELLIPLITGAGSAALYSAQLKKIPIIDILSIGLWSIGMTLVAFPLNKFIGWILAIQLGLFGAALQAIQLLRDLETDKIANVTTTAVYFGKINTIKIAKILILAAALYGVLLLHKYLALGILIAVVIPIKTDNFELYWDQVRLIFGLVWIGTLIWLYHFGSTFGFVFSFSLFK